MNAYRPPAGIGCGCRAQGCRPSPTIAYRARSLAQRSCVSLHPVKLISGSGESEPAWISIGEHAWGVFAFGQVARGAVAIGQMAIGLIAVGQLAVGLFAVGQVAASGTWSMAMLGIAGRGLGGVLRVLPKSARDRAPAYRAAVCEYGDLLSGRLAEGYIEVELRLDSDSLPELVVPVALRDLVGVVPEHRRDGGAFRMAPTQAVQKLVVADTQFWRRPGIRFESMYSSGKASPLEVLMRVTLWMILVLGVLAAVFRSVTANELFPFF
jgi:hypothetical protein